MTRQKEEPSDSLFDALSQARTKVSQLEGELKTSEREGLLLSSELKESQGRRQSLFTELEAVRRTRNWIAAILTVIAVFWILDYGHEEVPTYGPWEMTIAMQHVSFMFRQDFRDSVVIVAIERYREGGEIAVIERMDTCLEEALDISDRLMALRFSSIWACRVEDETYHIISRIRQEQTGIAPHRRLASPLINLRRILVNSFLFNDLLDHQIDVDALKGVEELIRSKVTMSSGIAK